MKISPIFYMGNKNKLIKKGLINLFPTNINTLYELFAGSCIVSMNTKANKYEISDINDKVVELYKLFKNSNSDTIIKHVEGRIEEYYLPKERTKRYKLKDEKSKAIVEVYKNNYSKLRSHYNANKNIFDMYTLMFFAFSQQMRFNNKGEFNMPFGNDCFTDKNKEYIKNGCNFFNKENVKFFNRNFIDIDISQLKKDDFVYLDPPYLNTIATYNENYGWNIDDENNLYELCQKLNDKGIKFGMSNVFYNKNIKNEKLINWCENKNWNIYSFDKMTYYACGKGNANTKEVYICNY